jgi:hypothetical protein
MATYGALNGNRNSPYGPGDSPNPYAQSSMGYIAPAPLPKKRTSNWIKFGIPVAIIVIVAAVVGGIFGSRRTSNSSALAEIRTLLAAASSAASVKSAVGRYATGTNSKFMVPVYPSTVRCVVFFLCIPLVDNLSCRPIQLLSPPRPSFLVALGHLTHSNLAVPAPLCSVR